MSMTKVHARRARLGFPPPVAFVPRERVMLAAAADKVAAIAAVEGWQVAIELYRMMLIRPLPKQASPETKESARKAREAAKAARDADHAIREAVCAAIKRQVALDYDVTVIDLESERKTAKLAMARREAMVRCVQATKWSFSRIGRAFNRDHTTVLYAVCAYAAEHGVTVGDWTPERAHEAIARKRRDAAATEAKRRRDDGAPRPFP
jgi:hypothetical protein